MLIRERSEQGLTPRPQERDGRLPGMKLRRRAGVVGIAIVGAIVLSSCSLAQWERGGMPDPITQEGEGTLSFWQGTWILALTIGIFVWGLIIWCTIAYRRKKHPGVPVQTHYNMPIEALWTIAPLIIVIGLFSFTFRHENDLTAVSASTDNTVNVVAFRWSWTFNYVNENVYDTGQPVYSSQESDSGGVPTPAEAPATPTLWLPVNETVKFNLASPDVIHSFWIPAFLYKLDVVPGRTNTFEVTPNQLGTFVGKCAELCGVDHSRMLFNVKVVTQSEFDAHVAELKLKGQTGQLETGRTSDQAQKV